MLSLFYRMWIQGDLTAETERRVIALRYKNMSRLSSRARIKLEIENRRSRIER